MHDVSKVSHVFDKMEDPENEFGKCVNSVTFILIERLLFFNYQHIVKALARKY